jgi:anti-anti-sigma regulatory factor
MAASPVVLPADLEFLVRRVADGVVLVCKGTIGEGETADAFRRAVADLLPHNPKVVVDLSEIHCLDRRGLEIIVSLYATARTAGATLTYVNLTVPVSDRPSKKQTLFRPFKHVCLN